MLVFIAEVSSAGDSLDDLGRIRSEINRLLEENKALESEYEAVRSEFLELQKTVTAYREEPSSIPSLALRTESLRSSSPSRSPLSSVEELRENEPGEVNEEGDWDLGQLQLFDAQYREEELELELQLKERSQRSQLLDDIKRVDAQNRLLRNRIFALRH